MILNLIAHAILAGCFLTWLWWDYLVVRVQPGPLDVGEIEFVEMVQNVAIDALSHGVSDED